MLSVDPFNAPEKTEKTEIDILKARARSFKSPRKPEDRHTQNVDIIIIFYYNMLEKFGVGTLPELQDKINELIEDMEIVRLTANKYNPNK
jgi:hypothetical protein